VESHYSQQCINQWNSLSQEAVEAPSINSRSRTILRRFDVGRWTSLWTEGPPSPMAARCDKIFPASLEQNLPGAAAPDMYLSSQQS